MTADIWTPARVPGDSGTSLLLVSELLLLGSQSQCFYKSFDKQLLLLFIISFSPW